MRTVLLGLLLASTAVAAAPPKPDLSAEVLEQVAAGKVVILSAPRGDDAGQEAFVTGVAEIAAPPEAIWPILLSLDHIRASSGAVKDVQSYCDDRVGEDHRILCLAFTLKVGFSEVQYHVRRDIHVGANYLQWHLDKSLPNDIAGTDGSYTMYPGSRPGTCLFVYRARIETGKAIPRWIEEELTQSSLKKYLAYVQKTAAGG